MADDKKENEQEVVPVPSFSLSYFSFGGRAASLRLAAWCGGLSYTDVFVTKEEHQMAKKQNGRRWSGLPEITIYGKDNKAIVTIGQSNACLRYIGSLCGLYPEENPLLGALCDEVLCACEDTRSAIMGGMATKEGRAKLVAKDGGLTYWLTKFELRLKENEERVGDDAIGYVCGNALTIADLKLFELFHSLWLIFESNEDENMKQMTNFPNIVRHYQLIKENENVKRGLQRLSLRFSEFKMDPEDEDIKTQTYKGKFVPGTL